MQRLSEEQKLVVEENIWVVNSVLKDLGLSFDNDLRQSALLYMCEKLIFKFDPARGTKFSTYATGNIKHYIRKELKARYKLSQKEIRETEGSEEADEDGSLDAMEAVTKIVAMREICNEKELVIVNLLGQGYTYRAIASIVGKSPSTVFNHIKDIRAKIK